MGARSIAHMPTLKVCTAVGVSLGARIHDYLISNEPS